MRYTITGSLGNISQPLTKKLIAAGHQVTVITSKDANADAIRTLGGTPAVGSVEDRDFLAKAFAGSDAVYLMIPPMFATADWKKWIAGIGANYAAALQASGVKYAVNLSSVGADLDSGCGPVTGLHFAEKELNAVAGTKVLHLRPSYFYLNLLANINLIRDARITGSNFGGEGVTLPLTDTNDIADAAFEALTKLDFKAGEVRYVVSDEASTDEIAKALGTAIGEPTVPWIVFPDDQYLKAMTDYGLPFENASNYVEMGQAIQNGRFFQHYRAQGSPVVGKKKLGDFANDFGRLYQL